MRRFSVFGKLFVVVSQSVGFLFSGSYRRRGELGLRFQRGSFRFSGSSRRSRKLGILRSKIFGSERQAAIRRWSELNAGSRKPKTGAPYTILISISTPAGRFKLLSDSIIFWLGFRMSTMRLWMRSSNCSRESLWTKVERFTV